MAALIDCVFACCKTLFADIVRVLSVVRVRFEWTPMRRRLSVIIRFRDGHLRTGDALHFSMPECIEKWSGLKSAFV